MGNHDPYSDNTQSRRFTCTCPECGYTVNITRKWLEIALDDCPVGGSIMLPEGFERREPKHTEHAHTAPDGRTIENYSRGIPRRRILGFHDDEPVTLAIANDKYRELIKKCHPDIAGSDDAAALQAKPLTVAIAEARAELEATKDAAGCENMWN